jgi:2-dehydro-3-deoxygluconokinase
MLAKVVADFPGLTIAAATLRRVRTASVNDWGGVCHTRNSFHEGRWMPALEIFDRVGGGDSFVSGLAYGLLSDLDVDTALAFGIAHGALAMTTPGDTSMATLAEVRRLAAGRSARVIR